MSRTLEDQSSPDNQQVGLIADLLCAEGVCSSNDEALAISELILSELKEMMNGMGEQNSQVQNNLIRQSLARLCQDYFDENDNKTLVDKLCRELIPDIDDQSDTESVTATSKADQDAEQFEGEDDGGEFIGDGECELCERFIKLTRHHLIPRSTWPRMETRLAHAADALQKRDEHRANVILGGSAGLGHLAEHIIEGDKQSIRNALQLTCNVCRPCHTAIHRTHDNMALAQEYNTLEKLLSDENIFKFSKWASKQRAGHYAVTKSK